MCQKAAERDEALHATPRCCELRAPTLPCVNAMHGPWRSVRALHVPGYPGLRTRCEPLTHHPAIHPDQVCIRSLHPGSSF